jgi:hypothetical protein
MLPPKNLPQKACGSGDDRSPTFHALSADGPVAVADRWGRHGAGCCAPTCRSKSSASQAVPVLPAVGTVSFRGAWRRSCRVCSGFRDTPNSRASRAVGSPVVPPRSRSTWVAGRGRVVSKTVPVRRVSEPAQA